MQSRLSQPIGGSGGGGLAPEDFTVVAVASNSQENIVLSNVNQFNKIELEYSFRLAGPDRIRLGRVTILFDGVSAHITSHEREKANNLAEVAIADVDVLPFLSGNNFGITVDNNVAQAFSFSYRIDNKTLV